MGEIIDTTHVGLVDAKLIVPLNAGVVIAGADVVTAEEAVCTTELALDWIVEDAGAEFVPCRGTTFAAIIAG